MTTLNRLFFSYSSGFGDFVYALLSSGLPLSPQDSNDLQRALSAFKVGLPIEFVDGAKVDYVQFFNTAKGTGNQLAALSCPGYESLGEDYLTELRMGVICFDRSKNYTEEQLQCCQGISAQWMSKKEEVENLLFFTLQQPFNLLGSESFSELASGIFGEEYVEPEPEGGLDKWPLVTSCKLFFNNSETNCAELFRPSPSLSGLVYSLNGPTLSTFITESANNLYSQKLKESASSQGPKGGNVIPSGQFIMEAVFTPGIVNEEDGNFLLAFHDGGKMPDFMANPLRLESGKEYIIKLKASESTATPDLESMSLRKRGCLFAHENERLTLFTNYSMSSCKLECMIGEIINKCHCLPWDLMHRRENTEQVLPCLFSQNKCPERVIASSSGSLCDCPLDCNIVKYSYTVQPKTFNPSDFCNEAALGQSNVFLERIKYGKMINKIVDPYCMKCKPPPDPYAAFKGRRRRKRMDFGAMASMFGGGGGLGAMASMFGGGGAGGLGAMASMFGGGGFDPSMLGGFLGGATIDRDFLNNLNPFHEKPDPNALQECKDFAKNGVKVTISYEDSVASRTVKISRVTFASLLSNLGKDRYAS